MVHIPDLTHFYEFRPILTVFLSVTQQKLTLLFHDHRVCIFSFIDGYVDHQFVRVGKGNGNADEDFGEVYDDVMAGKKYLFLAIA